MAHPSLAIVTFIGALQALQGGGPADGLTLYQPNASTTAYLYQMDGTVVNLSLIHI